jgi:hypothetical protein
VEVAREYLAIYEYDGKPNPAMLLIVLLLPLAVYGTIQVGQGWNTLRISCTAAAIAMLLAIPTYRLLFGGNRLRCVKSNGEVDRSGNILLPLAFTGLVAMATFVLVGAIVCYGHWFATFYRGVY